MNVEADASVYGSSWTYLRSGGQFTPSQTGNYNFQLTYYRVGKATGGGAQFSLFRRKPNGSIDPEVLESPNGNPDGTVTRDADFYLEADTTYDIEFETYASATTAGGGSFADYMSNGVGYDRHINPNDSIQVSYVD